MTIRCIAIDDEPLALQKLVSYIEKTPYLKLVKACQSAFEAIDVLSREEIGLMYVDINMPDLSGMEMVKSLAKKPLIIFTTAYSEYAVEGFKVDATDYLLKPFNYSDFLKASNKVLVKEPSLDYIFLKVDYKTRKLFFDEIVYIESDSEYIKIFTTDGKNILYWRIRSKTTQI